MKLEPASTDRLPLSERHGVQRTARLAGRSPAPSVTSRRPVPQCCADGRDRLQLSAQPAVPGVPQPGPDVVRRHGLFARDRLGGARGASVAAAAAAGLAGTRRAHGRAGAQQGPRSVRRCERDRAARAGRQRARGAAVAPAAGAGKSPGLTDSRCLNGRAIRGVFAATIVGDAGRLSLLAERASDAAVRGQAGIRTRSPRP